MIRRRCARRWYWLLALAIPVGAADFHIPKDPPKARYKIEAAIDPARKTIGGTETVTLINSTDRPLDRIALDWSISSARSLEIESQGQALSPLGKYTPLYVDLPAPVPPKGALELTVRFSADNLIKVIEPEIKLTDWYPRLWWDGLPIHDAFAVKIAAPAGYAMAASGRLNPATGYYEIEGARTFGLCFGKGMVSEERNAAGVLVRAIFTPGGADCARLCLSTAVDAVNFYRQWVGFYPFPSLTIIPGGPEPWGGYPFATGIVVIHGQEKLASRNADFWQWVTSHEIGHQYWGEYVLDPDRPSWLWIGLGIFTDREFTRYSGLSPERHPGFFAGYLLGVEKRLDTTIDIPPAQEEKIEWGRDNIVVHGKGFSVISALDSVLGREVFLKIYRHCLRDYGGRRLGWTDFRRVAEEESGLNLAWFFEAWVRSNEYLCCQVTAQSCLPRDGAFLSEITVESLGTMRMPIPIRAEFEDGTSQTQTTDRFRDSTILRFSSRSKLKTVTLDPERRWAMRKDPLPVTAVDIKNRILYELASTGAGERALKLYEKAKALKLADKNAWSRLGLVLFDGGFDEASYDAFFRLSESSPDPFERFAALGWMGMLKDLLGRREEALAHYREALKYDTGQSMRYDRFGLQINKAWIEERLKTPFRRRAD